MPKIQEISVEASFKKHTHKKTERLFVDRTSQSATGPLHDPVTWYGVNYAVTQVNSYQSSPTLFYLLLLVCIHHALYMYK